MSQGESFRIAYAGGGSRFVVTLCHGLASRADELRSPGRPIELALVDPDTERAGQMRRYAEITAEAAGLDLRAEVTDDRSAALEGSDWVIFSIGPWSEVRPILERLGRGLAQGSPEAGPMLAAEAAAMWPYARDLAADVRRLCPEALYTTLANPTDVLAPAIARAFGLNAVGICVEVPQLRCYLAFTLRVPVDAVELEYVGCNHVGWVTSWAVEGRDAAADLRRALPERWHGDNWYPLTDAFARVFELTGLLRTSPFHPWPHLLDWTDERKQGARRFRELSARAGGVQDRLDRALSEGRMIEEDVPMNLDRWTRPYAWPGTRWTLGAIAAGLLGADAGPVPIQARNHGTHVGLPSEAWLESPTHIRGEELEPQPVTPPPDWAGAQLNALATQRRYVADWLASGRRDALAEGLLTWPNVITTDRLTEWIDELEAARGRDIARS